MSDRSKVFSHTVAMTGKEFFHPSPRGRGQSTIVHAGQGSASRCKDKGLSHRTVTYDVLGHECTDERVPGAGRVPGIDVEGGNVESAIRGIDGAYATRSLGQDDDPRKVPPHEFDFVIDLVASRTGPDSFLTWCEDIDVVE